MGATTKQRPAAYVRFRKAPRFNRQRNGLDVLGKLEWTRREKSTIDELNDRSELREALANVTSRSSADVLSGRSFLAAHLDLGSWPSQKLRTRRSRHSQVGCTIPDLTGPIDAFFMLTTRDHLMLAV